MREPVIRRAAPADADAIADVWLRSRAASPDIPPAIHSDDEVRAWVSETLLPSCEVWVAVGAGGIVGMMALAGEWLDQLYISPGHQRRGHGRRLLELARAQRAQLSLWTFEANEGARRFYETHGFRRLGPASSENEERAPAVRYGWAAQSSRSGAAPETEDSTVTIQIVRHGQTDWNLESKLQGWTDIPLNRTGLAQAEAAAESLAGRAIGAVISSDLSRAVQTAELIAARVGVDVLTDPALRERAYGVAEGQLEHELDRRFDGRLDECWADPDFAFDGGETRRETHARLSRFLGDLLAVPPAREIVLVSHGGALRVVRGILEGIPLEQLPRWRIGNGEVMTYVVRRL